MLFAGCDFHLQVFIIRKHENHHKYISIATKKSKRDKKWIRDIFHEESASHITARKSFIWWSFFKTYQQNGEVNNNPAKQFSRSTCRLFNSRKTHFSHVDFKTLMLKRKLRPCHTSTMELFVIIADQGGGGRGRVRGYNPSNFCHIRSFANLGK